jgi:hypothetical protein
MILIFFVNKILLLNDDSTVFLTTRYLFKLKKVADEYF